jgi:hypothetical protein
VIRPDFGTFLIKQGSHKNILRVFYSVPITHISLVNNSLFTTLVNLEVEGIEYAVSFDFPMTFIGTVTGKAPTYIQGEIMVGLSKNKGQPYTIEFSKPFPIGIEAKLGQPQVGQHDQFVPFIVQKVFDSN